MAKLYPPSIEGKLPAFAGETLKIPITMNRAVSLNQVSGMRVMIKTVQTSQLKATLTGSLNYESTTGKYYAIFELTGKFKPNLGQYYKVQVAYVDKMGEVGYYSTIGSIKYTSYPNLTIPGLDKNFYGKYNYIGVYSQEDSEETLTDPETGNVTVTNVTKRDSTEKIYSYCFELRDRDGNLVATSGVQMHDASTDRSTTTSSDVWTIRQELKKDVPFYLQYKVTTMSGLEVTSARYLIMDQDSVDVDIDFALVSDLDYDNGAIQLFFYPLSSTNESQVVINGSFVLIRSSSIDDFKSWSEVHRFTYSNVALRTGEPIKLWEDYTVQQGIEYKYAVQAYNSYGLYSNKIYSVNKNNTVSQTIYADFEDAFLYDGTKQLKIRYNPKVSNFKETVLESKMDTIGSKYPFVFRNGNVQYKEFAISGLLSLQSDPDEKFLKGIQASEMFPNGRDRTKSYNEPMEFDSSVTSSSIQRERDFKLTALEWLNNGQPKLFRSPTEGNYIVRLINISLQPNDTLGRMLHTFNSTAYEIADCTFEKLVELNLLTLPASNTTSLRVGQISLQNIMWTDQAGLLDSYPDFSVHGNTINLPSVYAANITEATPGTIIGLNFANGQGVVTVEIGGTGGYYIQTNEHPLTSISLISGKWDGAKLTFNYYDDTPSDNFSKIADLALNDEIRQFIGTGFANNVALGLEDVRRDIGQFHYIKVMKRQIQEVWKANGVYYRTSAELDIVADDEWNRTILYRVMNDPEGEYYLDGAPNKKIYPWDIDYRFALNPQDGNDYMDLSGRINVHEWDGDHPRFGDTFGRVEAIRNVEKVTGLYIGTGIIVDVAYRVRTKSYVIEETDFRVRDAKENYLKAVKYLDDWVAHPTMRPSDYDKAVSQVETTYAYFIQELSAALARRE